MTTFDVGSVLSVRGESGNEFEVISVVTPDWARFTLAQHITESPMVKIIFDRLNLVEYRATYGAYDELCCYLVGVEAQGGVGFLFRIKKQWFMPIFQPGVMFAHARSHHDMFGEWVDTRVQVFFKRMQ